MALNKEKLYTLSEVQKKLQVSNQILKNLIKVDKDNPNLATFNNIRIVKFGNSWNFPKKPIDKWLETGETPAPIDEEVA